MRYKSFKNKFSHYFGLTGQSDSFLAVKALFSVTPSGSRRTVRAALLLAGIVTSKPTIIVPGFFAS